MWNVWRFEKFFQHTPRVFTKKLSEKTIHWQIGFLPFCSISRVRIFTLTSFNAIRTCHKETVRTVAPCGFTNFKIHNMMQKTILFALALLCLSPMAQAQEVQKSTDKPSRWYIGADAGISFGRATFASFGADKTRVGYGFGLLGGYHINTFLSAEAELRYSRLGLGAYDCCKDLWLGADGNRYYAPLAGVKNYRYGDLLSSVNLYELGLHLNIDFIKMFRPESRWSFLVSPAAYGIGSQATVKTTADKATTQKGNNQMHFGIGGDLGVGYQITQRVNLRLYSGMTYITGRGIDAMPQAEHTSNYTWNTGLKVTFALGGKAKKQKQAVDTQSTMAAQPEQPTVREEVTQPKTEPKTEPKVEPKAEVTTETVPAPAQPTEKVVYETAIYFSHNQSEYIEKNQYKTTAKLLKALADAPDTKITIVGWADKTGGEAQNETISARRAETVKRYLINKGITAERISMQGKGVDAQAADNDQARRAEVKLIITEK